ncbi:unnamed protein product [Rotaria socialis]
MIKRLLNAAGNMMLELLDEAESERSNTHNPHRATGSEVLVCEFCRESLRQDLLHQHRITCPQNPARARVPHSRRDIQHRRQLSPLPHDVSHRLLRPPPIPPRSPPIHLHHPPMPPRSPPIHLHPPPIPPRPIRSQSQNLPTSITTRIPDALLCPITSDLFEDPVLAEDGHTYERQAIVQWIRQNGTSPITREPLHEKNLRTNYTIRKLVEELHLNNSLVS